MFVFYSFIFQYAICRAMQRVIEHLPSLHCSQGRFLCHIVSLCPQTPTVVAKAKAMSKPWLSNRDLWDMGFGPLASGKRATTNSLPRFEALETVGNPFPILFNIVSHKQKPNQVEKRGTNLFRNSLEEVLVRIFQISIFSCRILYLTCALIKSNLWKDLFVFSRVEHWFISRLSWSKNMFHCIVYIFGLFCPFSDQDSFYGCCYPVRLKPSCLLNNRKIVGKRSFIVRVFSATKRIVDWRSFLPSGG